MSWRLSDVSRLSVATGRKLLRVGSGGEDQIELVFERREGENAELLVTLPIWGNLAIGEIDLALVEHEFGRSYGLGRDEIEGVPV
jgi:hypothetical protein